VGPPPLAQSTEVPGKHKSIHKEARKQHQKDKKKIGTEMKKGRSMRNTPLQWVFSKNLQRANEVSASIFILPL
jgi:hypothetical protein